MENEKKEPVSREIGQTPEPGHSFRSGFATLIGRPNVGKSTLMNHLIGQKIAITSNKPQTTRNRIRTVFTGEKGQIVFLDTPGIHQARNKLGEYMVDAARSTFSEVDVILWLVEPTTFIGKGEQDIARRLSDVKAPVILIINKIDLLPKEGRKEKIAACRDAYAQLLDFADILPVSALRSTGVDRVIDAIMKRLPYGPPLYDEDTVTDQPRRQIAAEMIREKALRCLDQEIPHGIAVSIDSMKERSTEAGEPIWDIDATIICERDSHKGMIIGKGGSMLKRIGSQSRHDMEALMEAKVNLKLWVKVKKDWRDSDFLIKNFGYDRKEL